MRSPEDLIVARSGVPLKVSLPHRSPCVRQRDHRRLHRTAEGLLRGLDTVLDNQNKLLGVITAQSLIDVVE